MWYMGETFDKIKNKKYKTLEGGLKQAQAKNLNLYDETGETVHLTKKKPVQKKKETIREEHKEEQEETEIVDGVEAIKKRGVIRRVFNGQLRIRKEPSWDASAVKGVSMFLEKKVTHKLIVDGKTMYRTEDGRYISGEPEHVKFMEV